MTGQELHDAVALLSQALTDVLHVQPGDCVALLGLNSDAFLVTLLAVLDAGAVGCPMNWRWSVSELTAALELTQPVLLLADQPCTQLAAAAVAAAAAAAAAQGGALTLYHYSSCSCMCLRQWTSGAISTPQALLSGNSSVTSIQTVDARGKCGPGLAAATAAAPAAAAAGAVHVEHSLQLQLQLRQPQPWRCVA